MSDILERLKSALADRYAIEKEVGQGGMATVYLAEDLKHKRNVALKVLRSELAAVLGAERFVQEITTTASLQHPNILPLFDSGEADGFLYYVMPYIEGETLREKLNRETQLGISEAVKIAIEVAEALESAHQQGVIHRDIKPENILLHDGRPMVADFGIALAVSAAAGGRMTETGLSLGTPHYMSPEQATAEKELTARSDVYSLGSVLYEMLTGNPPHVGASAQQIIMKIVTEAAEPVTKGRKSVPPNVAAAVATSLEKLPADRFDSAKAFADALGNDAFTAHATAATIGQPQPSLRGLPRSWVVAGVSVVLVLLAAALLGWLRPSPSPGVTRQRIVLFDSWGEIFATSIGGGVKAVMAPDGSSVVYWDTAGTTTQLYQKRRNEAVATLLSGTEGASSPFFSPDAEWIGFVTVDGRIRKIPNGGGGALTIAEQASSVFRAAVWMDDGSIVYTDARFDLRRVGADGAGDEMIGSFGSATGIFPTGLSPLPGSRGVLVTGCAGNCTTAAVYVFDIANDSLSLLFEDAMGAWYSPTGHVLYTSVTGGLYAAPFDPRTLEVGDGVVPVLDDVGPGQFSLSDNGFALYGPGLAQFGQGELVWVDRNGAVEAIDPDWQGQFNYPALSPDGSRLAVTFFGDGSHLWVKQIGGGEQKLTSDGSVNWRPSWSSSGDTLAFISNRAGGNALGENDVYARRSDGSAPAKLVLDIDAGVWEAEFSRDGRWLAMRRDDPPSANSNIFAMQLDGDSTVIDVVAGRSNERQIALSPDARWLAYASNESGRYEIYLVPFPDADSRQLISNGGGTEPRWSPDGRELFFKSGGMLVAVPVAGGDRLTVGEPQPLFSIEPFLGAENRQQYDVSPDGQRFVMIRLLESDEPNEIIYVENWFEELKQKLGD